MRNAILALLVLAAAAGLWWVYDREPNLAAGQAELDAQREASRAAAAETTPLPVPAAEADPYETTDDPEYKAARAEREARLAQIREEAERRAEEEERRVDDGAFPIGGGATSQTSDDADSAEALIEEESPEDLVSDLAALEEAAADRALELELVSEDRLDALTLDEQRDVLSDEWIWHRRLEQKFGNYTLEQKNLSSAAFSAIQGASPEQKLAWLRELDP